MKETMEAEIWTCDREQCRHYVTEEPKPALGTKTKWSFLAVTPFAVLIGIIPALIMAAMLVKFWKRRPCPACKRGNMLSNVRSDRGRALAMRERKI